MGRCFCFDGPYRRLRWRRAGSGPPLRTVSPASVAESRIGSSPADRIACAGGGEPDRVLPCGPYRLLRWRRAGSGPPMRTVSPAPVAESRIGSSYADRIGGSGGGEPDRVLLYGPVRRLRWRRAGSGPHRRTEPLTQVPENAIGSPSWSASRRGSPLPSWEPGRPEPAAVVDALRSPGRAPASRACRRGLRGSGRGPQDLASWRALRELLLGLVEGGGAEQRWLTGCAPSGTGTGTFTGTGGKVPGFAVSMIADIHGTLDPRTTAGLAR
jgi:hypothetical protein